MAQESQAFSIRAATHRYVNRQDMPEQLFDQGVNPSEMQDLGRYVCSEQARAGMRDRLLDFPAGHKAALRSVTSSSQPAGPTTTISPVCCWDSGGAGKGDRSSTREGDGRLHLKVRFFCARPQE